MEGSVFLLHKWRSRCKLVINPYPLIKVVLPRRHKGFTKNDICTSNWLLTDRKVQANVINRIPYRFLRETAMKTTYFTCKSIGKFMKNQWNPDFSPKITRLKFFIFFERFFYIFKNFPWNIFWYHVDAENAQLSIAGIFSRIRFFSRKTQHLEKNLNFFQSCDGWAAQL